MNKILRSDFIGEGKREERLILILNEEYKMMMKIFKGTELLNEYEIQDEKEYDDYLRNRINKDLIKKIWDMTYKLAENGVDVTEFQNQLHEFEYDTIEDVYDEDETEY